MAVAWQFQGPSATYTVPAGDEPLPDSQIPEEQPDLHVEFDPLGATGGDATIDQYIGKKSIGAKGGEPFVLHFHCTAATRTELRNRKNTTFTIRDFNSNTISVLLTEVRSSWLGRPMDVTKARVHVWAKFLARGVWA